MNRLPGFLPALCLAPALPAASTTVLSPGTAGGVAILSDDLPTAPATASPDSFSRILQRAGMNTVPVNCREPANANTFNQDELRTTNGWQRPRPPALPRVSQVLWRYRIPADEIRDRGKLTFSGFLKAQNVRGSGMAYFAVYQFAADGRITEWQDVCRVRGAQDWKEFQHAFRVHPQSKTVELHAGLYQCSGVTWFDDLQLTDADGHKIVTTGFEEPFDPNSPAEKQWRRSDKDLCAVQGEVRHSGQRALEAALHYSLPPEERLNTRHGIPEDGLTVEPTLS